MSYDKKLEDDPRFKDALEIPIDQVCHQLGALDALKRIGRSGWTHAGPCPRPGCGGDDRFSLDTTRNVYNCRTCGGGDQIHLVRAVLGYGMFAALDFLCGKGQAEISPQERERRDREAAERKAENELRSERERRAAIKRAWDIWQAGVPAAGSPVVEYFGKRGITSELLPNIPRKCLRFHPSLRFMVKRPDAAGWDIAHQGPAMLAAMQGKDGKFQGVHRTWFDFSRDNGRAVISYAGDEIKKTKKTMGSTKGAAIRLIKDQAASTLVLAEGIETLLTAYVARPDWLADAAFWSGVDLGNMSGRRIMRGKGMRYAGAPDMSDDLAFVPPEKVRRLVLLMDGDSEPRSTKAQLLSCARRAMQLRPGLTAKIIEAREGEDFNDMLLGARDSSGDDLS